MSDDDDFMQDSEQENYDFEFEDSDDDQGGDVGIENKYYNAKQLKAENPEEAIVEFLGVPELEQDKGDWGFKGLKQAIKLEITLANYEDAITHYKELLTYVKSAVTRNYSEKSINNLLDFVDKASADDPSSAGASIEQFYSLTLASFQATNNERLWLKTNVKMAKLWLDRKDYGRLAVKLRELHRACQNEAGEDDPAKGTQSLEVYALEIQMYAETRNNKRLKALYQRALAVKSAVPHPKIMGIIRECGGKMHMSEENWKEAQSDFFESFRNYDEAGSMQRIQVLKYLVLTTMLMRSNINPFDSQETKPYKDDPRIAAMTDLVDAFQRDDVHRYEAILQANRDLLSDAFIAENIDEVTRTMRTKAVLKLVAPFRRFTLKFLAKKIQISVEEVQDIVGVLIVEGKLAAKINQEEGTVTIIKDANTERLTSVREWTESIRSLASSVLTEGDGFKVSEESSGMMKAESFSSGHFAAYGAKRSGGADTMGGYGGVFSRRNRGIPSGYSSKMVIDV